MAQTSNLTNFAADLKELYTLPPVRTLDDRSFLHNKLTKEQAVADFSGKYVPFPVTLRRSLGRGSRGDEAVLPNAISEVLEQAKVRIKFHYYGIEWSDAIEQSSKNKEGAFEQVVTMKMKNLALDLAKEANRQFYNDTFGSLATVSPGANSATQTLITAQYVSAGDKIDIVSSDGTTKRNAAALYVGTVNKSTRQITLVDSAGAASSQNTTTGDLVIVSGNITTGATPVNHEVEGLRHIAKTDRTLHDISSVTYEEWDGYLTDLNGAVAGESTFEQLYDGVGEKGRGDIDLYLSTRGIRRRLADEFASMRRYVNEKGTDLTVGFESIEVNGKPCVIDDDAPKGEVIGLGMEALKVFQLTEPGFVETDGSARVELKRNSDGDAQAVYQAWYRYYMTLACTDPGRTGRITDAADDF